MEHYKSRNNDYFHFTNPHDDRSELDEDDYDELQSYDVDDDRSCDFSFHTFEPLGITQSPPLNFQTNGMKKQNDALTSSKEELGAFDHGDLIFVIEHSMKKLSDKLQHTIEGIGTRISCLDDENYKLDKYIEDVKNCDERYHGTTHRKLGQMQSILQEVRDGVQLLRDKHEIAETHLHLARLEGSKRDLIKAAQTNELPSNETAFSPSISYGPPGSIQNQTDPPFAQFTQSYQLTPNHYQETPNGPSYSYSSNFQHYPFQPAIWASPQEPKMGSAQLTSVPSSRNYMSEFHAKYMPEPASFSDVHPHSKPSSSHETTKELPYALPTASDVEDKSSSEENSNTIPVHDIIDKVTAMGFRRDLVRGLVRKLSENGSSIDLNMVLDKMINGT